MFELNMGDEDPVEGFMIHVRGGGQAVTALLQLATERREPERLRQG
ncbi:MAG: hypothetical protein OXT09_16985 [Myxococcales bacterium]|nr:hypothetical protein [Myxococcales bacterium]